MVKGIFFDIKEFSVNDGPGLRMTVFMKGCPLTCAWCHNPESHSSEPEVMKTSYGQREVGTYITPEALAERILEQAELLKDSGGGVTFSGGEPLMQSVFLEEVLDLIPGVHTLLDTSGHCSPDIFKRLLPRFNMLHFDLKIMDPVLHKKYCGFDNSLILKNLETLKNSKVPFIIRVPMIPGISDTLENLSAIARSVESASALLHVDLLPYNKLAGGKHASLGKEYMPHWNEESDINYHLEVFKNLNVKVKVA